MSRLVVSPAIQQLLEKHGCSVETGSFAPVARNHGTWETYLFVMGGLGWTFCVSTAGVPEIMRHTYIKESGQFFLVPLNGDAFLYEFSLKAVRAGNITKADVEESIRARAGFK